MNGTMQEVAVCCCGLVGFFAGWLVLWRIVTLDRESRQPKQKRTEETELEKLRSNARPLAWQRPYGTDDNAEEAQNRLDMYAAMDWSDDDDTNGDEE